MVTHSNDHKEVLSMDIIMWRSKSIEPHQIKNIASECEIFWFPFFFSPFFFFLPKISKTMV